MKKYSFEDLPAAVGELADKLAVIESLIKSRPQSPSPEKLLNIEETARFLGLTRQTIYEKVARREIPVNKKGKRLYFLQSDLLNWIRSGKVKTNDEIQLDADDWINKAKANST